MKKHIDNDKIFDAIDLEIGDPTVSHFETTGLIPALPENDYEEESYQEIYNYQQRPIARRSRYHNP